MSERSEDTDKELFDPRELFELFDVVYNRNKFLGVSN